MTISSHKDMHVLTLLVMLQRASVKSVTMYKRYTYKTEYLAHITRYKNGRSEL
jgi:hypothetical protein